MDCGERNKSKQKLRGTVSSTPPPLLILFTCDGQKGVALCGGSRVVLWWRGDGAGRLCGGGVWFFLCLGWRRIRQRLMGVFIGDGG